MARRLGNGWKSGDLGGYPGNGVFRGYPPHCTQRTWGGGEGGVPEALGGVGPKKWGFGPKRGCFGVTGGLGRV